MKKILIFLTLFALLTSPLPSMAQNKSIQTCKPVEEQSKLQENTPDEIPNYISKSQFPISAIDPTPSNNPVGAYYPGLRAGNQLLIYTPKFGERTGTNEFGAEAVVVNGVVTDFTGSNSLIPQNGFVISGHGKASKWIKENLIIGALINIDTETSTIESVITPESYIFKANQTIIDVQKVIAEYKKTQKGYTAKESDGYLSQAVRNLNEAKKYAGQKDLDKVKELSNNAVIAANNALYYAIPAKPGEFHGVWLRPTEKTSEDIIRTLDRLYQAGIENVFVETYYQGYTIFPSKTLESYGVIPQRKEFRGWDPLKVWIEEAHKRNMKIHVWFQTFYTGNEDISKNPQHVISAHPSWANVQRRNYAATKPMPSKSEHNGYFLDPANPEVQTYLRTLITEIANNYAVDGLNIDYIRYPASMPGNFPTYLESTWGYSNYARNEFMTMYGVDPAILTPQDPLWQKWIDYRQGKVTSFVASLKSAVNNKNILLSAVVFPDVEESSVAKLQNWQVWGQNRYVDAFTPLVMGSDETLVKTYIDEIKSSTMNNVKVFPGLFEPFTYGDPSDLLYQLKASREEGAGGIVIFDYAHLNDQFINALKARALK